MNPGDAAARGLGDGDLVRVFNDRGSCVAGLVTSADMRPSVVQLSTGAWSDPDANGNCRHGNPNVLTADRACSTLSQGCTAQHTIVEVERLVGGSRTGNDTGTAAQGLARPPGGAPGRTAVYVTRLNL